MPHKRLVLSSPDSGLRLRAIGARDLEDLRYWKNSSRHAFFTKRELSPEDQATWYAGYVDRPDDWMFVVENGETRVGCMGFRLTGKTADVYNVIAAPESRGQGLMKAAMRLLCEHLRSRGATRIEAKVVRGNPALKWYEACGYEASADMREYVLVTFKA